MHRIDTASAQTDKFGAGKNGYTNGDSSTGRSATQLDADVFDAYQEEICAVIEEAGIALKKGDNAQLLAALKKLFLGEDDNRVSGALQKDKNLEDLNDITTAKKNLSLDNVGNYKAVQANGGLHSSGTHSIYIDWGEDGKAHLTVDNSDEGEFFTTNNPPTAAQCDAFPAEGGTVGSKGIKSPALFVNNHNMAASSQGMYLLWNEEGGTGEGDIVVNPGSGTGGLRLRGVNSDNSQSKWVIAIDGGGSLNTATGTLSEMGQRVHSLNNPPTQAQLGSGWWKDNVTGLIIQMGAASNGSSNVETHNLNIAFPNSCIAIVGSLGTNISLGDVVYLEPANNSQFNSKTTGNGLGYRWIAVGN